MVPEEMLALESSLPTWSGSPGARVGAGWGWGIVVPLTYPCLPRGARWTSGAPCRAVAPRGRQVRARSPRQEETLSSWG